MILQALTRYYYRLLARDDSGIAPYGFSAEKIGYAIMLDEEGGIVAVNDIRDTSGKKPLPRTLTVPQPAKRTAGITPNFLWDKTSYVLGVSTGGRRDEQEHAAFREMHLAALADTEDAGLLALKRFLEDWMSEKFDSCGHFTEEMKDANMVFRLGAERLYMHERPAAQSLWAKLLDGEGDGADESGHGRDEKSEGGGVVRSMCLVEGKSASPARLHPAVKGVNGAQSSGASIVSFNLDAFTSYGKSQGENAPVSREAAFAYTTVLNYLLRRGEDNRQCVQIGDASVVFWAEADDDEQAQAAELFLGQLAEPKSDDAQETEKMFQVLEGLSAGRPLREIDPRLDEGTRMYVLGLAPNASRLSIRFWESETLGVLAQRIADHARDMRLEPRLWKKPPSFWLLALVTAPSRDGRHKAEDVPKNLAGEIARAIFSGNRYPRTLLGTLVMRFRADGDISALRVALCKAVLRRDQRKNVLTHSKEEVPVSLDKQSTNAAYRLGRLFAVLENVQRAALGEGLNATIRDRYYGGASATPASIFPVLLRNTQNHLGKLRKEKKGLAIMLEKEISDIIDGLPPEFPLSLRIEDQGRFAIGYFHQSHAHFTKKPNPADNIDTESAEEGAAA